jgi:3-deoxy-D-manno-octulosonate 8-phosphate phosphatase (KDO 8-P phosphatase)
MNTLTPAAARRVRLLGLDVDGVLTDNGVFIGPVAGERVELKRFDIQDGLGLILLRTAGLPVVWLSGRSSEATALRAAELRVEEVLQVPGPRKAAAFVVLLDRRGIEWADAAFVGDDLADLPVLRKVGLPIAVANAVPEVKSAAKHVTQAAGGHGAVREIVEAILRARGDWGDILDRYFADGTEKAERTEKVAS